MRNGQTMKQNMDQKQTVADSRIRYITKVRIPQKRESLGHPSGPGRREVVHTFVQTDRCEFKDRAIAVVWMVRDLQSQ